VRRIHSDSFGIHPSESTDQIVAQLRSNVRNQLCFILIRQALIHSANSLISLIASLLSPTYNYSDVCTKYQEASKIINLALQGIVAQCLPGASIIDISEFGRTVIVSQSAKLFTKKVNGQVVDRGVAFPVCISVNDIVCNHAPLESSEERVSSQPIV
jgi:hypothetical protein